MAFLLQFCQASFFFLVMCSYRVLLGHLMGHLIFTFSFSKKTVVIRSFIGFPSLTICHLVAFCFLFYFRAN